MINWHELVLELKRKTGLSWVKLAHESGVNKCVIEDMAKGGVRSPRFDNGFALLCYAREVGADKNRIVQL